MNIKLDENIPHRLVGILVNMGHEVDTVQQEGLAGHWEGCFAVITEHKFRIRYPSP
jgi:hypothetical protein